MRNISLPRGRISDYASKIYSPSQNSSKQHSSCPQQVWHIAFLSLFSWQTNLMAKQRSKHSSELPTAQGQLGQHVLSLCPNLCLCCTFNGKSFNTASGELVSSSESTSAPQFCLYSQVSPTDKLLSSFKEDTAGTSRTRVQARGILGLVTALLGSETGTHLVREGWRGQSSWEALALD